MALPGFTGFSSEYKTVRSYTTQSNKRESGIGAQWGLDFPFPIPPMPPIPGGGNPFKMISCTNCCKGKAGFGACFARCMSDSLCCDNGHLNASCEPA